MAYDRANWTRKIWSLLWNLSYGYWIQRTETSWNGIQIPQCQSFGAFSQPLQNAFSMDRVLCSGFNEHRLDAAESRADKEASIYCPRPKTKAVPKCVFCCVTNFTIKGNRWIALSCQTCLPLICFLVSTSFVACCDVFWRKEFIKRYPFPMSWKYSNVHT